MIQTMRRIVLPLFIIWSSTGLAATCYTVEGEVKTVNKSPIMQVGTLDLLLLDKFDNEAFRGTASLVGTITGADISAIFLSHTASFDEFNGFVTNGDRAVITGLRKFDDDGVTPCSFTVVEQISQIASGSGFFQNVSEVDIVAEGYISSCLLDGENENEFELSGTLCVE